VEDYFVSIERSFENKLRSLIGRDYSVGMVVISLVSLVAIVLAAIGRNSGSRPFGETRFWDYILFPAIFLISVSMLGLFLALEQDTRNLKKGLPQAQMRFALCYRLVRELEYFRSDESPPHLDEALRLWTILFMYLYWMLNPSREQLMLSRRQKDTISGREQPPISHRRLPRNDFPIALELEQVRRSYPWLKISPDSEVIIQAFAQTHVKISGRLRDGVEVPQVTDALEAIYRCFCSASFQLKRLPPKLFSEAIPKFWHLRKS